MKENTQVLYQEVQRFRQPWLWSIIITVSGFMFYGLIKQLIVGNPFGSKPAPDVILLFFEIIFGLGFPILFYRIRLTTEVRSDGIHIRFFPFHFSFRNIPFDKLKGYQARTYSAIKEYGGWGIRFGLKGKAYNVSGNRGVELELIDGHKVLIGSQQPENLTQAIDQALKQKRL
jgi:hypothetical protein